jgi:hypothetical protein
VSHTVGLFIEGTVAILLLITIGYCYLLDRRLRRLRADEHMLRAGIAELITATETAERAIGGLKLTVADCDRTLGERLRAAERFSAEIERQLAAGEKVLRRISQIAAASRSPQPPSEPPSTPARATLAAAQAFAARARTRGGDAAA